jgi:hypothetical protein|tara:strand:- start:25 stop:252 length:228 start_codon:yes stop_codon:yes gene_type:complete
MLEKCVEGKSVRWTPLLPWTPLLCWVLCWVIWRLLKRLLSRLLSRRLSRLSVGGRWLIIGGRQFRIGCRSPMLRL